MHVLFKDITNLDLVMSKMMGVNFYGAVWVRQRMASVGGGIDEPSLLTSLECSARTMRCHTCKPRRATSSSSRR